MKKFFTKFLIILFALPISAQSICGSDETFKILHFTKTNGFDHNTRVQSAAMFTEIGLLENFIVVDTSDASIFDELDSLLTFAAIVFSNTSGGNLLNSIQKQNVEDYYATGKGFLGIHAATDTYRNGGWPYYNDLIGGIVQTGPNHTSQNHVDTMDHQITNHPILDQIPNPWVKEEEYYYWDLNRGMVDTTNFTTALKVRRTGPESYDRERPISWFRTFNSGSRSFYTALGHKKNNYTDPNNEFRQLVRNGLCWVAKAHNNDNNSPPDILSTEGVFLTKNNAGIMMKSEDGTCWKLIIENDGTVKSQPVTCPDE